MNKFLLDHDCTSHCAMLFECPVCLQTGQPLRLLFPEVRRAQNIVVMIYPVICECGGRGSLRVEFPILLFGMILARIVLKETKCKRHRGDIDIQLGVTDTFRRYMADFEQAIIEFAEQALGFPRDESTSPDAARDRWAGLGDPERVKFGLSVTEWQEFLRRLGLGEDEEAGGDGAPGAAR